MIKVLPHLSDWWSEFYLSFIIDDQSFAPPLWFYLSFMIDDQSFTTSFW